MLAMPNNYARILPMTEPGKIEHESHEGEWFDIDDVVRPYDKDEANGFFIEQFRNRLVEARQRPNPCYVIPFSYMLDSENDSPDWDIHGGLWIPPMDVQDMVHDVGSYIHWRLGEDLSDEIWDKGIVSHPPFLRGILELSEEVPVVRVMRDSVVIAISRVREQVEADYEVKIRGF